MVALQFRFSVTSIPTTLGMLDDIIELQRPAKLCPKGTKYALFLKTFRDIPVRMCDELTEQNLHPLTRASPSHLQTSVVYHLCSQLVSKDPGLFICLSGLLIHSQHQRRTFSLALPYSPSLLLLR